MGETERTYLTAVTETRQAYYREVRHWLHVMFHLLKALGMGQTMVGKHLGVSQSYITQWMSGKRRFPAEMASPLLRLVQERVSQEARTGEQVGLYQDMIRGWHRVQQRWAHYGANIADVFLDVAALYKKGGPEGEELTPEAANRLSASLAAAGEHRQDFDEHRRLEEAWDREVGGISDKWGGKSDR